MNLGIDWAWGVDWCVRSVVAMAWIGLLVRWVGAGSSRFWLPVATGLAVVSAMPWRWHGGVGGNGWGLSSGGDAVWATVWTVLWSSGAVVVGLRRLAGWIRVRTWCRAGEDPVDTGHWRRVWEEAVRSGRVAGDARIRVIAGLRSPAVWVGGGAWLLVPRAALGWGPETCQRVCLHEVGHLRAGDAALHRVWMLVDVLQWWNPVWWWVRSRLELEMEKRADAWVVAGGRRDARAYARDLVDWVERGLRGVPSWGGHGGLEERVDALLRGRSPGVFSGGLAAMVLAVLSVVVLAVVFRGPGRPGVDAVADRDAEWRMAANPFPAE